jgi:hypothetical protein
VARSSAVTPLMFEHNSSTRRSRIEAHRAAGGEEVRILRAADVTLRRKVARLTCWAIRSRSAPGGRSWGGHLRGDDRQPDHDARGAFAASTPACASTAASTSTAPVTGQGRLVLRHDDGACSGWPTAWSRRRPHHRATHPAGARRWYGRWPGCPWCLGVLHVPADLSSCTATARSHTGPDAEQLADITPSRRSDAAPSGGAAGGRCCRTDGASASARRGEGVLRRPKTVRERAPVCSSMGRSSTTPRSTAPWRRPSMRLAGAGRATVFIYPGPEHGKQHLQGVQRSANAVAVGRSCRSA